MIKNTEDLERTMGVAIEQVMSGKLDHKKATAISGLAGKILGSHKLKLEVAKFVKLHGNGLFVKPLKLGLSDGKKSK